MGDEPDHERRMESAFCLAAYEHLSRARTRSRVSLGGRRHARTQPVWILARERQLSAADFERILGLIEKQSYDRAKIALVPQPKP